MTSTRADNRGHWPKGKRRNSDPFPEALRARVVKMVESGATSYKDLARLAGIPTLTLRRWMLGRDHPSPEPLMRLILVVGAMGRKVLGPPTAPHRGATDSTDSASVSNDGPVLRMPSTERRRLKHLIAAATEIVDGLEGLPFVWRDGEATAKATTLATIGVELVTKETVAKFGHRIKSRAEPVGCRLFGYMDIYSDLYILGVQTHKRKGAAPLA